MGVDGSNFNTGEWGLQEPLKVAGKGDGVCELLEPQEQGHDMHFKVPLSYVIEDHVSNPGAIVVCTFLPGIIVLIEMHIVIMLPAKGEESHEEFLY